MLLTAMHLDMLKIVPNGSSVSVLHVEAEEMNLNIVQKTFDFNAELSLNKLSANVSKSTQYQNFYNFMAISFLFRFFLFYHYVFYIILFG